MGAADPSELYLGSRYSDAPSQLDQGPRKRRDRGHPALLNQQQEHLERPGDRLDRRVNRELAGLEPEAARRPASEPAGDRKPVLLAGQRVDVAPHGREQRSVGIDRVARGQLVAKLPGVRFSQSSRRTRQPRLA
jgi:hypothetical protein